MDTDLPSGSNAWEDCGEHFTLVSSSKEQKRGQI